MFECKGGTFRNFRMGKGQIGGGVKKGAVLNKACTKWTLQGFMVLVINLIRYSSFKFRRKEMDSHAG